MNSAKKAFTGIMLGLFVSSALTGCGAQTGEHAGCPLNRGCEDIEPQQ